VHLVMCSTAANDTARARHPDSSITPFMACEFTSMAGLGLSDQKNAARRDHAHRDRRGLFSIHTKYGHAHGCGTPALHQTSGHF
jgi:hypothetical protein